MSINLISNIPVPIVPACTLPNKADPAIQDFIKYMNESPVEKFADQWLAVHHLTRDDLKYMAPEKRKAIMELIAQEFKRRIEEDAAAKKNTIL